MDRCTRSTRRPPPLARRPDERSGHGLAGGRRLRLPVRPSSATGSRGGRNEGSSMLHVTCDLCGKELRPGEDHHFVVKVEVFSAHDPAGLTEADLDEDHMEAFGEMLREADEERLPGPVPPACQQLRYDLCTACRQRYLRDPLGREADQKFDF